MEKYPTFRHFSSYAKFLLKDEALLAVMAEEYLASGREYELPLLKHYSHLPETEQHYHALVNLKEGLLQAVAQTAKNPDYLTIDQWKADQHPNVPSTGVTITDIVMLYSLRKQVYMRFLTRYTRDVEHYGAIVLELDAYNRQLEQYAFEAYVEIQQARLKHEKRLTECIINNSHDGIMAFDHQQRFTLWNKSLEERFGMDQEAVLGKKLSEVFPELEESPQTKALAQALQGTHSFLPDHKVVRQQGWYETRIFPLHDNASSPFGAVSIVHDISQWKESQNKLKQQQAQIQAHNDALSKKQQEINQAYQKLQEQEAALRASRDYYLTILEDFPSLIWRANTEGLCDYFNKTWLAFRGRSMQQEEGNGWAEGVHPDDFDRCLEIYTRNFKDRTAFAMEYRMLRHDGVYRWIIDHGTPIHDDQGNFIGFLGACFDIQDRKDFEHKIQTQNGALSEALEALKQTQAQLEHANTTLEERVQKRTAQLEVNERWMQLLTDAMPTLISYVDKDEVYRFVNKTYSLWFGIPREKLVGSPIKEVIGDEVYKLLQPQFREVLSGREVKAEGKMNYRYGGARNVSTNLIPHVEAGEVKGFYGLVYDVTEIRKVQESLEAALSDITYKNKQLSKINNDLDSFVYTASHDLRNPVINLSGLLQALKKRLQDIESEEINQLVAMMEISIGKLNQTIRDLTEITKAQKGLEEPEENISIKDKLEDIKADLHEIIEQSNPIIREDLQVKTLTYARRNLRSILYNLITNAIKYRSEKRPLEIDIRAYEEAEWVVLEVQDNGLGLSEQQRQKLFTMFKRLHTHVDGTGIGLYIIKRVVENHGGKIEVISQLNVGSTFKVYLKK